MSLALADLGPFPLKLLHAIVSISRRSWSAYGRALKWVWRRPHWGKPAAILVSLVFLVAADQAVGYVAGWTPVSTQAIELVSSGPKGTLADSDGSPPLSNVQVVIESLPEDASAADFTVLLGGKTLRAGEFEFVGPHDGTGLLTIPGERFPGRSEEQHHVDLRVLFRERVLFDRAIELAVLGHLEVNMDRHTVRLEDSGLPREVIQSIRPAPRDRAVSPRILVQGPGSLEIGLPDNLKQVTVRLDGKRVDLPAKKGAPLLLDLPPEAQGLRELALHRGAERVDSLYILRKTAPLRETVGGVHYLIPPKKQRFWILYSDRLVAGPDVDRSAAGTPGHHNLRFHPLSQTVRPGVHVIGYRVAGLEVGSLAIPWTHCFVALVPGRTRGGCISFKLAHGLKWPEDGFEAARTSLERQDIELRRNGDEQEVVFRGSRFPRSDPSRQYRIHLVVEVKKGSDPTKVVFSLYIDGVLRGLLERSIDSLPFNHVPEIRHRGCENLSVYAFEYLYFEPR